MSLQLSPVRPSRLDVSFQNLVAQRRQTQFIVNALLNDRFPLFYQQYQRQAAQQFPGANNQDEVISELFKYTRPELYNQLYQEALRM